MVTLLINDSLSNDNIFPISSLLSSSIKVLMTRVSRIISMIFFDTENLELKKQYIYIIELAFIFISYSYKICFFFLDGVTAQEAL